jgi:hypothetical protein
MENTTAETVVDLTALHMAEHLHARLHALEEFVGTTYPGLREQITEQARWMAASLHLVRQSYPVGEDVSHFERAAERMARRVCVGLFGREHPPARFWSTPLGADVAWSIGYPTMVVPTWAAAAVCAIDRTYVYIEERRGRLELTAKGVRSYIRSHDRWTELAAAYEPDPAAFALRVPSNAAELGERTRRPSPITGL